MSEETKQGNFSGWAIVEMMGHRKEIGFVTTEAFGAAALFRVDTPELEEREYTLASPEYASVGQGARQWCPAGTKVKRPASPARSCLVSPNSLYAMNPCTEEAARQAIEASISRPLIALELPADMKQLPAPGPDDDEYDRDDDPMDAVDAVSKAAYRY